MVSNDVNPLYFPDSSSIRNIHVPMEKDKTTASLANYFPVPGKNGSDLHPIIKGSPIKDVLLEELKQILNLQEEKIEKDFEVLESYEQQQDTTQALLEIESWHYSLASWANTKFNYGIDFLRNIFPADMLEEIPAFQKVMEVKKIANLGTNFLSAIDCGSQGLVLICKTKILEQSKEIFNEIKEKYAQDLASKKGPNGEASLGTKQKKIEKTIQEWDLQIQLEEKQLAKEKLQFEVNASANTLRLVTTPYHYISQASFFASPLKLAHGLVSWLVAGLDIVSSALTFKQASKDVGRLNQWKKSFKVWQERFLPKFNLSETGKSQRDAMVNASKSLLVKRQALLEKKIIDLRPQFPILKPKIQDFKKQEYHREIQQLLWETLQNPCTPQEIEEKFQAYGFFDSAMATQNQQLINAFEQFKNNKPENAASASELQKNVLDQLAQWMKHPTAMDQQFQQWFNHESSDKLLSSYLDHQETIEITTKNALKQMVNQKHDLENRFLGLKLKSSAIYLGMAGLLLTLDVMMKIMGVLTLPMGGIGIIFLIVSNGYFFVNLGLFAAGAYLSSHYKPYSANLLTIGFRMKMAIAKLNVTIRAYFHQAKDKKLIETAQILYALHSTPASPQKNKGPEYQKALENYKKAKADFQQSQNKVNAWTKKINEFEQRVAQEGWKDFAQYASLKSSNQPAAFDTLRALQLAIESCDLSLLSDETKQLLEVQLGINMEDLKNQINKDPKEFKNILQKFFALDDAGLVSFINHQRARFKKGLLL